MKFRSVVLVIFAIGCSSKGAEPAPAPAPVVAAPAVDAAIDALEHAVEFTTVPADEGKMGSRPGGKGDAVLSMSDENRAEMQKLISPEAGKRLAQMIERNEEEAKNRPPTLTPAEINKVVKSRAGLYKACYQKELDKKPTLAGKVVMRFTITAEGTVTDTSIDPDRSTLLDENVGTCLRNQFTRLKFPAKGISKINYPLIFTPQT